MTVRAFILGLLLGLFVAGFTYFNDHVIGQTFLIGNHLPASVFGLGLLGLLAVNPLLRLAGERWPLRPGELAIILAMGLATCGWPGSNLMRSFTHLMAMPAHEIQARPNWLASGVLSYVPGQSPMLAHGYVTDWPALTDALRRGADPDAPAALRHLWSHLPESAQWTLRGSERLTIAQQSNLLRLLNQIIAQRDFYDAQAFADASLPAKLRDRAQGLSKLDDWEAAWLNRALLEAVLPGLRSPPAGSGVMLEAGGDRRHAIEDLALGGQGRGALGDVPWRVWWPTLRLWGGTLLLIALATLCLMMIVHPQWTQRELLRYPIPEFVAEVTRWSPGRWLPDIASSRLFWMGLAPVMAMHTLNSLGAWFPDVGLPTIDRNLPLWRARDLFPNASRVPGSWRIFVPFIYPSVIGFGFFITTRVSLSIGLSLILWVVMGSWLLAAGIVVDNVNTSIGGIGPAMRFGAYVGMTAMIVYFGRHYYLHVLTGSLGGPRRSDTPGYAIWAARALGLCIAGSVFLLTRYGGLTVTMSVLLVVLLLMMLLVLARINVETGMFYAQPDWLAGIVLAGLFGISGLGAESLVILLVASQVFSADPREGISPYLANGLRMGDRIAGASPRRLAPVLAGMLAIGLVVSIVVTLWLQYGRGLDPNDRFAADLPRRTLNQASAVLNDLAAHGESAQMTRRGDLQHFIHARPDGNTIRYAAIGMALVLGCAAARLRLPWWPLHPVLFLVWGTYPANHFAFSFLLAALVKTSVTRLGGVRAYTAAKPLMIGLIAGDILAIVLWSIVGTIYYFITGLTPPSYMILPV